MDLTEMISKPIESKPIESLTNDAYKELSEEANKEIIKAQKTPIPQKRIEEIRKVRVK